MDNIRDKIKLLAEALAPATRRIPFIEIVETAERLFPSDIGMYSFWFHIASRMYAIAV
jgi:hypothetical protein